MESHYANTDLELAGVADFAALIGVFSELSDVRSYLRGDDGKWYANINSKIEDDNKTAIEDIVSLLNVTQNLSGIHLDQWLACERRNLNIGLECGETWAYELVLPVNVLSIAASQNCSISITLYPL